MLFISPEFMFLFLPIVLVVYFLLNKFKLVKLAIFWLVVASLYFYSYFNVSYIWLILSSIVFNYFIGSILSGKIKINTNPKLVLITGIVGNILLLSYYKYFDFLISNINLLLHSQIRLFDIILPIGISFFTFTQTAYLVDAYKGKVKEYNFVNYMLFVTYFPHLIAGPILHHSEMMPQFENLRNKFLNWENMAKGLFRFIIGLFKKVVIADTLSRFVVLGFDTTASLSTVEAWITFLSYSFQIYYDFSGYTDMALGVSKMFNIELPENFNNPYKAIDIQDFWRRWHITLSRFLKDYIYIPLGGNRAGTFNTYRNLLLTFLIGGIWHGASWMFIIWGAMHGIGSVINRLWKNTGINLPKAISWLITFMYINVAWVFFRAENLHNAVNILKGLVGFNGFSMPKIYFPELRFMPEISGIRDWEAIVLVLVPVLIALIFIDYFRNNARKFKPTAKYSVLIIFMFMCVMYNIIKPDYSSPFIYFNF